MIDSYIFKNYNLNIFSVKLGLTYNPKSKITTKEK